MTNQITIWIHSSVARTGGYWECLKSAFKNIHLTRHFVSSYEKREPDSFSRYFGRAENTPGSAISRKHVGHVTRTSRSHRGRASLTVMRWFIVCPSAVRGRGAYDSRLDDHTGRHERLDRPECRRPEWKNDSCECRGTDQNYRKISLPAAAGGSGACVAIVTVRPSVVAIKVGTVAQSKTGERDATTQGSRGPGPGAVNK